MTQPQRPLNYKWCCRCRLPKVTKGGMYRHKLFTCVDCVALHERRRAAR